LMVIGDPVNVAARLQQLAQPGTILAGERTYEATKDRFDFGPPQLTEVRGKSGRLALRRVIRPREARLERRSAVHVPMVGRESDVETLARRFHDALETASPRMTLVVGQAGIGKSRLVREFLNLVGARHPERIVLQGRCPTSGKNLTYWALGELLRRECGIAMDDSSTAAEQRLRQKVEAVLAASNLSSVEIDRVLNALAMTAGIRLAGNPLEEVRPSAVDLEQAIAWPRFISAYAARQPVIMLIEDLHWADERLLTMLQRVLARSTGPLLIIGTARPEFRELNASFGTGNEQVDFITLRPLSLQQGAVLLEELLQNDQVEEGLQAELLATADGNPFFLEEIVQRLLETGVLQQEGGRWRSGSSSLKGALPDSVQAVLSARIDALPPAEKRALQEAAVVGRVFWERPVQIATGDADLTSALLALENKGLITVRPTSTMTGDLEFVFKHALVRDVAYASLPMSRRARAHAQVAEWIETSSPDRREELSELIAQHYRSAISGEGAELAWGQDPKRREALRAAAFEALLHAGVRARKRYAVSLALELHQEALALASGEDERARALEALGDDQEGAFHGDDAVAAWEEAASVLSGKPEHHADRVRLLVKCAKMTCIRWGGFKTVPPTRQVDAYINQALEAAPREHDRGWLLAMRSYLNTRKGDPAEIEAIPRTQRSQAGEEAVEIARKLGDVDLEVLGLRALSGLWISAGDYARGMEVAHQEGALIERIAAARDRALAVVFYALRLMDIEGRYEAGLEGADEAYRLGKDLTIHEVQHATYLLIYGNAVLGRWSAIDRYLDEHLDAWRQEHDITCPYARAGPLVGAWALARQGKVAQARSLVEEIPLDWDAPSMPEAWYGLARLACGDPAEARSVAERILATNRRLTYEEGPFEYWLMLEALVKLEDWAGIAAFLGRAEGMSKGLAILDPVCLRTVGVLDLSSQRSDLARAKLEQAVVAFERLGASAEASRTRELLARRAEPV